MSAPTVEIDTLFGMKMLVRDGLWSWRCVTVYRGLEGYRAWCDAGRPMGLAAILWAERRDHR